MQSTNMQAYAIHDDDIPDFSLDDVVEVIDDLEKKERNNDDDDDDVDDIEDDDDALSLHSWLVKRQKIRAESPKPQTQPQTPLTEADLYCHEILEEEITTTPVSIVAFIYDANSITGTKTYVEQRMRVLKHFFEKGKVHVFYGNHARIPDRTYNSFDEFKSKTLQLYRLLIKEEILTTNSISEKCCMYFDFIEEIAKH
jgi:hypothetical protein